MMINTSAKMLPARLILNQCVASFFKAKKLEKAEALIVDGIVSGIHVDNVAAYNALINANCEFGRLNVAYALLGEMKEAGISPDAITYKSLIAGATKRNLPSESIAFLGDMHQQGILLDIGSYNSMMHDFFQFGLPYHAYLVFWELLQRHDPAPEPFNIVINGLCNCKEASYWTVDRALLLFRVSKHFYGFEPGLVTYNNLFNSLCKTGRFKTTRGILKEFLKSGHETTAAMYNTLMKLCFRSKQYCDLGLEIISVMRSKGFSLDGFAYCTIISGLVRAGRMEEANDFKEQMMSDGNIQLNIECYNTLLHLCFKQGNHEAAKEVLEEIKKAGLELDQYTHNIMINAFCKAGDILGAVRYFDDMNMMGFRSNFVAFNCLIDCFCKHGHIDQAIELFELKEEKDSTTYTTMANNLCKAGRFGWASKLIIACLRDGIRIPKRTQRAVLDGIRNSRREEARAKIYSISTCCSYSFGALVSEELAAKILTLPKVLQVFPDCYLDVPNKDYGCEPFIDGQALPNQQCNYHEKWKSNALRGCCEVQLHHRHSVKPAPPPQCEPSHQPSAASHQPPATATVVENASCCI